jgi:hypothetical protein
VGGDPNESRLYQLALIKGRVDPFNGDYRAALALVKGFVDTLLGLPEVEAVHVLQQPLDVRSDAALSGDTTGDIGEAPFELRVVIRDKPDESS